MSDLMNQTLKLKVILSRDLLKKVSEALIELKLEQKYM